jgi:dTDP-4-dehydrorhamnose reductase
MRVAVTGANGRLGRAVVQALADSPYAGPGGPIPWARAEFDLDEPGDPGERLGRDRVEAVVHAAAWTDVDGCARDPQLAMRRNAHATEALARACAQQGVELVYVSTNEVFDGRRTDARPYEPDDQPNPINPYGASKLAGERAVEAAWAGRRRGWHVVRTSWLFGPPGRDFPDKILAAGERATQAGEPLKVVSDEHGAPTYTRDLAEAIVDLLAEFNGPGPIHHLVNAGVTSRAGWARELFRQARLEVELQEVPASTWQRASTPPLNAVLAPTPTATGEPMRPWQEALADYLPLLRRHRAVAAP